MAEGRRAARLHDQPRGPRLPRRRGPRPRAREGRCTRRPRRGTGAGPGAGGGRRRRTELSSCARRNLVLALGSHSRLPADRGISTRSDPWTNREATSPRRCPRLPGAGRRPNGRRARAGLHRYGVPTTIVRAQRAAARAATIPATPRRCEAALRAEGVTVRTGVRALRAKAAATARRRARDRAGRRLVGQRPCRAAGDRPAGTARGHRPRDAGPRRLEGAPVAGRRPPPHRRRRCT